MALNQDNSMKYGTKSRDNSMKYGTKSRDNSMKYGTKSRDNSMKYRKIYNNNIDSILYASFSCKTV